MIEKMPNLAEHFSRVQCDITIVATDWFLCLFCTTLPSEVRAVLDTSATFAMSEISGHAAEDLQGWRHQGVVDIRGWRDPCKFRSWHKLHQFCFADVDASLGHTAVRGPQHPIMKLHNIATRDPEAVLTRLLCKGPKTQRCTNSGTVHLKQHHSGAQTSMRVWDALLCEGPKILYRVSLALLKTNEAALMQIQDAGSMLRHLRAANASIHDRDALMTVSF